MLMRVFVLSLVLVCAACSAFPVDGPNQAAVRANAAGVTNTESDLRYELINLTAEGAELSNAARGPTLSDAFRDRRPAANIRIGLGDVIGVTIFEATSGGLFIPNEAGSRAGNFVALPNQTVDRAGFISVPYAGAIKAAGRTPSEVQNDITARLRTRAIEPQAVVSINEQRSQQVSVLGEVNSPARLPVMTSGEHLLDSIARAGGVRGSGVDLFVRLVRDGRKQEVHFSKLTSDPRNNIFTLPGDTIYVYRDPPNFLAFGASGQQGQFNFEIERMTLAEAVAKAGGLLDDRADPGAVLLYRTEPRETARLLGVDIEKYPNLRLIPVIYSLDLRDPRGFFTASKLAMRDKDILFVTNAPSVEVTKFLQFVRIGVAAAREAKSGQVEVIN